MRVVYIGNHSASWSTENDVRLGFEACGAQVVPLQENQVTWQTIRQEAVESDLLLWTRTWPTQPLDESISTFHACARLGIPTAALHLDTFWSTSRGGEKWWEHPMFHAATLFTADGDHQADWERWGKRHIWLPPAVRHTVVEDCATPLPSDPRFVCDVAFVGSDGRGYHEAEWPYRRELVKTLAAICKRRGWSWRNFGGSEPKVDRSEMAQVYASVKVAVGDSLCPRREASLYWSDRYPETTGRRGFLISPQIDALAAVYPTMPMYRWGSWDHLEHLIESALSDDAYREEVSNACYQVTAQAHTYQHRAASILKSLEIIGHG